MSTIRSQSFETYARPASVWRLLGRPAVLTAMLVLAVGTIAVLVGAVHGLSKLTHSHRGPGAFYELIAYVWLVVPGAVAGAFVVAAIAAGGWASVRDSDVPFRAFFDLKANLKAVTDVLGLANLRGGGGGCHDDEMSPSATRRRLHNLVFYGFLLMVASTTSAAIQQEFLDRDPPYSLLSVPVILGTLGGIATVVGCAGFAVVGQRAADAWKAAESRKRDRTFGVLLMLTAGSGLLLLALRSTPLLGLMLVVHLGIVGVFFIALPYSKFVHAAYRYLALVRFHVESRGK
jgi:citrate/tricarballylate utilization protein